MVQNKKKIRGLKRKCRTMVNRILELTATFPKNDGNGYWHMHLPVSSSFIDSPKTIYSVRRLCIQTLIDGVKHLIENKPDHYSNVRVVASIVLPNLWDS